MENIILITGKVKYTITLDPGVWIFDHRKRDLSTFFLRNRIEKNELDEYTKEISSQWSREITEGTIIPKTVKLEDSFQKEKLLSGTFGIPFKPFLLNASPLEDASQLIVVTNHEEITFNLSTAIEFILCFSKDGKPLIETGPIHIYFSDGSNQNNPITNVKEFRIK